MNIRDLIAEEEVEATTLQVFHRRLKVPVASYLDEVQDFTDPWNERAYQQFIQHYLQELGDPGIIGMVRQEQVGDFLVFDAAVRYPIPDHVSDYPLT